MLCLQVELSMKDPRIATVKLPEIPPEGIATLLDFYLWRFPRIAPEVWRRRFREGKVFCDAGPLAADAPYRPLLETRYVREVEREAPVRRDFRILHQDADLIVVDKPPFLPVTPSGRYLENCLLHLLSVATGEAELAPLHRIDKDTAGLTLFSRRRASRSHFARLFRESERFLEKEYRAVCEVEPGRRLASRFRMANRLARESEDRWLTAVEDVDDESEANAVCDVEVVERRADRAMLRLAPRTGRRHQLRAQLAHAGLPIVNDRLYGSRPRHDPEDLDDPLALVCRRLAIRGFPVFDGGAGETIEREWRSGFGVGLDGPYGQAGRSGRCGQRGR